MTEDKEIIKSKIIEADLEFIELLESLKKKVGAVTWGALDNVGYRVLTKILARKVKEAKLI